MHSYLTFIVKHLNNNEDINVLKNNHKHKDV